MTTEPTIRSHSGQDGGARVRTRLVETLLNIDVVRDPGVTPVHGVGFSP